MNDAALQLLLLLGYLAIGLISITFPIYAICVTYLRQEKWESEKERKQRIEKLKKNISKLSEELSGEKEDSERFKQMQKEKENYDAELESLKLRVGHLTARGAVGKPLLYLGGALLSVGIGIYYFYQGVEDSVFVLGVFSAFCSSAAVYDLYKTLSAVEYAALRPARTIRFEVCYKAKKEKSEKVNVGKEVYLSIGVCAYEESVENLILGIYFPPDIEIREVPENVFSTVQPSWFTYPFYTLISYEKAHVFENFFYGVSVCVRPKKIGKYTIPVRVRAKGVYGYNTELTLEVVS